MAQGLAQYRFADPDRLLVSDGSLTLSRAAFDERVNRTISLLRAEGIDEGARLGILAKNSTDFMTVAIGCSLAGISVVPVNTHLTIAEVSYILEASKTEALVVGPPVEARGKNAAADAGIGTVINMADLEDRLADAGPDEPAQASVATPIYFTSGTTGRPKATQMIQHPQQVPVSEAIQEAKGWFDEETVHLTVGPLYHAGPLVQAIRVVMAGGQLHVMPKFLAEDMLRLVEEHRVNSSIMVPTHFVRLLNLDKGVRDGYDVSSLESVLHIAAMMPAEVKREMIEWWGPILDEAYGSSEIGVITLITSEEWLEKPGSVGRPVPPFSVEIVGEEDQELPAGEIGQIYITSHGDLDLEYLDDPEKTAAAHREERQFTLGDMGWLDEDGYLYLADRRDDLIISGGANIYPAEVEAALITHPAVEDVGVIGVPHPEWGSEVRAVVTLRPGSEPSPDLEGEILNHARQRLASYKLPPTIDFVDDLPRYDNGKLHRRELRERYVATAGRSAST